MQIEQLFVNDDGSDENKYARYTKNESGVIEITMGSFSNSVVAKTLFDPVGNPVKSSYLTGENIEYTIGEHLESRIDNRGYEYQYSQANRCVNHEAMRRAGLGGKEVILGNTVPIKYFMERGKEIKSLKEENINKDIKNQAGEDLAEILKYYVLPEAVMAYVDVSTDTLGHTLKEFEKIKSVLVLDPGGNTICSSLIHVQENMVPSFNSNDTYSCIAAIEKFKELAQLNYQRRKLPDYIVKEALSSGMLGDQDVSDIVAEAVEPIVLRTIEEIKLHIANNYEVVDMIVLAGGGADLIYKHDKFKEIIEQAGDKKIIVPENARFCVARGALKSLYQQFKDQIDDKYTSKTGEIARSELETA